MAGPTAQEIPGLVTVTGYLSLPPLIQIQASKRHSEARVVGKQTTGPQGLLTMEEDTNIKTTMNGIWQS